MAILIVADHANGVVNAAVLNVITAAVALGGDVDILVAGDNCAAAAGAVFKRAIGMRWRLVHPLHDAVSLVGEHLQGQKSAKSPPREASKKRLEKRRQKVRKRARNDPQNVKLFYF